jgi:hypothetical protein
MTGGDAVAELTDVNVEAFVLTKANDDFANDSLDTGFATACVVCNVAGDAIACRCW